MTRCFDSVSALKTKSAIPAQIVTTPDGVGVLLIIDRLATRRAEFLAFGL